MGYILNNELYHYGVKGQKWGVIRTPEELGHPSKEGTKQGGSSSKNQNKSASKAERQENRKIRAQKIQDLKNVHKMSDEELMRKLGRLEKEKKMFDITMEQLTTGRTPTTNMLISAGRKAAGTILAGAALYGVKTLLTGNFNIKEMAGYLTPKPKK